MASTVLWVAGGGAPGGAPRHYVNRDLKDELICELAFAMRFADKTASIALSPDAELLWSEFCTELSLEFSQPGNWVASCYDVQLLRLSMIIALLGQSAAVESVHVEAAMAFLRHTIETAQLLFFDYKSDGMIEKIQDALVEGPKTLTQLHAVFSRKRRPSELNRTLAALLSRGVITATRVCEGGRPKTIYKRVPVLVSSSGDRR